MWSGMVYRGELLHGPPHKYGPEDGGWSEGSGCGTTGVVIGVQRATVEAEGVFTNGADIFGMSLCTSNAFGELVGGEAMSLNFGVRVVPFRFGGMEGRAAICYVRT